MYLNKTVSNWIHVYNKLNTNINTILLCRSKDKLKKYHQVVQGTFLELSKDWQEHYTSTIVAW